ncbi:unnamed protein product [Pedinophyceae sp. YPF-701]|nr:unnamed protein product [Pedinophyceae sp. YPF-701]
MSVDRSIAEAAPLTPQDPTKVAFKPAFPGPLSAGHAGHLMLTWTEFSAWCEYHGQLCRRRPTGASNVLYLMLTGSVQQNETVPRHRESWARDRNLVVFSDAEDSELGVITTPEIEGKPERAAADHRQIKGLQWLARSGKLGGVDWVVFIDDDTWVNPAAVDDTLSCINPDVRVAIGRVWGHVWSQTCHFSGGAGMILSVTLAKELAVAAYGKRCPDKLGRRGAGAGFFWNDLFISECVHALGGMVVHHAGMHAGAAYGWGHDKIESLAVHSALTFHKVPTAEYRVLTAIAASRASGLVQRNGTGRAVA